MLYYNNNSKRRNNPYQGGIYEKDIPTQEKTRNQGTWFQEENANQARPQRSETSPQQRQSKTYPAQLIVRADAPPNNAKGI